MSPKTEHFRRLIESMNSLRRHDWTMPSQRVRIFLAIVAQPGISAPEIERDMIRGGEELSQTAISRHINALAGREGKGRKQDPMEALIERRENPSDRTTNLIYPTALGRQVAREMLRAAYGDEVADDFSIPTAREANR